MDFSLPNNKIIFKLSHPKNQDIKRSGCYGIAGTNSYSIRFCSFMSAYIVVPFNLAYIECAHYPQFYAQTQALRKDSGCVRSGTFEYM